MSFVKKWVLGLFLVVLAIFGICWVLMVRFEVESRYSQNFKISPLIGNLFLIKSGQWKKVRQVKFVLTPEKQNGFLSYEGGSNILVSSGNMSLTGINLEIIANYHQNRLDQIVNED